MPANKKTKSNAASGKKKLDHFLKEVVGMIAGKQSEEIVDLLHPKKYINEFLIAKRLNITINQTRNILYKISDHGLVSSIRKKDKKKGWHTYFWKIEPMKSLEFLKNDLLDKIAQTKNQIKSRETKRFYICPRCHIEMREENALLYDFTCRECGSLLELKDNAPVLNELEKSLGKLERDLKIIEAEISIEEEKSEKGKRKKNEPKKKPKKTSLKAKKNVKSSMKKKKEKTKAKKSKIDNKKFRNTKKRKK